ETRVETFDGPRIYELVQQPAVHHVVRPRETLASIANRYGVSIAGLRELNGLRNNTAPRGARLLIRPASTQTMLTTERGDRRVVARNDGTIIRTSVNPGNAPPSGAAPASAPSASTTPSVAGKQAPARKAAPAQRGTAPKAAPARNQSGRTASAPATRNSDAANARNPASGKTPVTRQAAGKR